MENGGGGGGGAIKVGARARVSVELKPGKTTVVSWKKLLREANFHYSSSDSDSIDEPVDYVQEEELKTKTLDSLSNRKKILQLASKTESSRLANNHTKRRKKDTRESLEEKNDVQLPSKYKKRGHQQIFASENEPCVGLDSISQVFQNHEANSQISSRVSLKKCSESNGAMDFPLCEPLPSKDAGRVSLGKMHGKTEPLIVHSRDPGNNGTSFVPTAANQKYIQKLSAQLNPKSHRSAFNNHEQEGSTNNCVGSQKGKHELPDLNLPYTKTAQVTASMRLTDPSNSKGKRLERAIRRLGNLILTSKPPLIDVQEADASSVAVGRSLPQEIREKLAEIASLARLIDGNISEELIDRLMGILGKYLHRKNLKRILREMVIKEFFVVKEGDNDIKQFKKDIVEMIRVRATLEAKASKHQDDSANDFQRLPSFEEKVGRNIFIMDNKVEDKLCDLYDAFVQGLDDYIAHSLARRLYAQLAALWPKGTMDKHEIQKAICRAQDRKRILSSQTDKDGEKYKTNMLSIQRADGCVNGKDSSGSQARTVHKKL